MEGFGSSSQVMGLENKKTYWICFEGRLEKCATVLNEKRSPEGDQSSCIQVLVVYSTHCESPCYGVSHHHVNTSTEPGN